jgi:hypothetical protein
MVKNPILNDLTPFLLKNFITIYNKLGPPPLPIVGNLLSLMDPPTWKTLLRWRKKYGDLFTFWMGEHPIVTLNDYKTIYETFQKDGSTYENRTIFPEFDEVFRSKQKRAL